MKIELSEDYEEKIMSGINERRKNAQKMRKKVLSIVIVFACLFGITSMGYCQFKKNEYTNYFISDSENQLIEDEYQYFDGLGIKLNFINYAEDSIVIGINLKYDDIANKDVYLEKCDILDIDTEYYLYTSEVEIGSDEVIEIDCIKNDSNEIIYILEIIKKQIENVKNIGIKLEKIKISEGDRCEIINLKWEKIIPKGKE